MSRPDQRIELDIEGNGDVVCDADRIAQVVSNVDRQCDLNTGRQVP